MKAQTTTQEYTKQVFQVAEAVFLKGSTVHYYIHGISIEKTAKDGTKVWLRVVDDQYDIDDKRSKWKNVKWVESKDVSHTRNDVAVLDSGNKITTKE